MKKKGLGAVLALVIAVTMNGTVLAAPNASNAQKSLNEVKSERQKLEGQMEELDNQIEAQMLKIDENKKEIEKINAQMETTKKNLAKAENDIKGQQDKFNKRVRAMYMNGSAGYVNTVLESKGLSDMFARLENVQRVMNYDKTLISGLNEKRAVIDSSKKSLEKQSEQVVAKKTENEQALAKMQTTKSEQQKNVEAFKQQEKQYGAQIAQLEAQAAKPSPASQPSRGGSVISGGSNINTSGATDVVSYAKCFLGVKYVYGGTSPSGFDCSGFVQYVYAHFGVSIGRSTYDQINDGTAVSRDQLQAGDLVFFGSASAPHHVGMYIGGGQYIHAPHTGDVVKISTLDRSDFCAARRVR